MQRRPALTTTPPTRPRVETQVLKQADSTLQVNSIPRGGQRVIRHATGPSNNTSGLYGTRDYSERLRRAVKHGVACERIC